MQLCKFVTDSGPPMLDSEGHIKVRQHLYRDVSVLNCLQYTTCVEDSPLNHGFRLYEAYHTFPSYKLYKVKNTPQDFNIG